MNRTSTSLTLAALAFGGLALTSASAQNPNFAYGDLVLAFQSNGGVGSGSYLFANLGPAGLLRDFTTSTPLLSGNLSGLNSSLVSTFGSNWFERTDLFVGAAAIGSSSEFNGYFGFNDPDVTPYVGIPRQSVGTIGAAGSFAPSLTASQTQDLANGTDAAQFFYESAFNTSIAIIPKGSNFNDWDDQNPISGAGVQGPALGGVFSGGVQQAFTVGSFGTFGSVNAQAALDLYRVQAVNNIPGQFGEGQPVNLGTYEGSILIDSLGNISLGNLVAVPEPSLSLLVGAGMIGVMARRRRAVTA